jgi:excisionase family DNA binding protein
MDGGSGMVTRVMTGRSAEIPQGSTRLLLRVEESADALGLSRARMYELLSEGRLKSIKVGRSRRIPISELNRWIDAELAEQSS